MRNHRFFASLLLLAALCLLASASLAEAVLTLPKGMTVIEEETFCGAKALEEVVLPEGLRSIGARAFADSSLKKMTIPASVTQIAEDAFEGVGSDAVVYVSSGSYAETFFEAHPQAFTVTAPMDYTPWEKLQVYAQRGDKGWIIEVQCFASTADENAAKDLILADTYKGEPIERIEIADGAFSGVAATGRLVLPACVTKIGSSAFAGSQFTGHLVLPSRLEDLGAHAFSSCSGLTGKLVVPGGVKEIPYAAFSGCDGLTGLELKDGVETIGGEAFWLCRGLKGDLILPDSVISIGAGTFDDCGFDGKLELSESLITIGELAFDCCDFVGDLVIPNSVVSIARRAFSNCAGLNGKLTISDSMTTIGESAFENSGFTSLKLGKNLTSIGESAFSGCSSLKGALQLPSGMKEIGPFAFRNCGFEGYLSLPVSLEIIGAHAFSGCTGFKGTLDLKKVRNVQYWAFKDCSGFTDSLLIPATVESIGNYAFEGCSGITKLVVADMASCADNCFRGMTGIRSASLGGTVTEIHDSMFLNCTKLQTVKFDTGSLKRIGQNAFENCASLLAFDFSAPLETIDYYAFRGCTSLTGVLIMPRTLTGIRNEAFAGCTGLSGMSFPGTTGLSNSAFLDVSDSFTVYSAISDYAQKAEKCGCRYEPYTLGTDVANRRLIDEQLYEGDPYIWSYWLREEASFNTFRVTITDDDGDVRMQVKGIIPRIPYDLGKIAASEFSFDSLACGNYRMTLEAVIDNTQIVLSSYEFEVIPAPVRLQKRGISGLEQGVIATTFGFSGSISCNYTITAVDVELKNLTQKTTVKELHIEPGSSTFELNELNDSISMSALTPLQQYRLTIHVTANGKKIVALTTPFIISDSGKDYTVEQLQQLNEFVSNPANKHMYDRFTDGIDKIADMTLLDGANFIIQGTLNPGALLDELIDTPAGGVYLTECYRQQILNLLSSIDEDMNLVEDAESPWAYRALEEIKTLGGISKNCASLVLDFEGEFKKMADAINTLLDAMGSVCTAADLGTMLDNDVKQMLTNYENSMLLLNRYTDAELYATIPSYRRAVEQIALDFTRQAESAVMGYVSFIHDLAKDQILDYGVSLLEEAAGASYIGAIWKIVKWSGKIVLGLTGATAQAEGLINLAAQQNVFSSAIDQYKQCFNLIAEGDTSLSTIRSFETWTVTACASGGQVYQILHDMHKAKPFVFPMDEELLRLVNLQSSVEMLIYRTPFAPKN